MSRVQGRFGRKAQSLNNPMSLLTCWSVYSTENPESRRNQLAITRMLNSGIITWWNDNASTRSSSGS